MHHRRVFSQHRVTLRNLIRTCNRYCFQRLMSSTWGCTWPLFPCVVGKCFTFCSAGAIGETCYFSPWRGKAILVNCAGRRLCVGLYSLCLSPLFFPWPGISDPAETRCGCSSCQFLSLEANSWLVEQRKSNLASKSKSPILVSHLFSLLVQYIRIFTDLYLKFKKNYRPKVILLSGVDICNVSSP